jgi:hypothetical protein
MERQPVNLEDSFSQAGRYTIHEWRACNMFPFQSFDLILIFACASALLMAEIWRPNASRVFLSAWALLMLRSHRQRLPVFVTTRRISSRECWTWQW